ncbi:hypothetical protein EV144_101958 [Flavobacterium sp. 270]|uniref:hypothetical protein n=1 Tax=Flavobacterium sp. 270 TaxID=2512114 RepID=UPI0010668347|nr:hypothetical protein [Flavobacterium sp. 270]TDW52269.1 hypothetical protein EV144_101958 [Flavobacterium sp. 270]
MNLLDYKTFQTDIEKYLYESINTFKLRLNVDLSKTENESLDYYLFYENEHCIISLNLIDSFPYLDVTPKFYLKNSDEHIEINQVYLKPFLSIDEKEFEAYCLENYNNRFLYSDDFNDKDKGTIYYSLYSLNEILLKYYYDLFKGKYSIIDYRTFSKRQI